MEARVLEGTLTESENPPSAAFSHRVVMRPFTVGTAPSAKVRPAVSGRTSKVANPPLVGWIPQMYFRKIYAGYEVQAWFASAPPKLSQLALLFSSIGR